MLTLKISISNNAIFSITEYRHDLKTTLKFINFEVSYVNNFIRKDYDGFCYNQICQIVIRKKLRFIILFASTTSLLKPTRCAHVSSTEALLRGERRKCLVVIALKKK